MAKKTIAKKEAAIQPPDRLDPIDHAMVRAAAAERDLAVERANLKVTAFRALLGEIAAKYGDGDLVIETGQIKRTPVEAAK